MSEYTPDTERVREAYEEFYYDEAMPDAKKPAVVSTEFDRWLAEVERAAAEKAWAEGELAGTRNQRDFEQYRQGRLTEEGYRGRAAKRPNPYRRNEGDRNNVVLDSGTVPEEQVSKRN